MKTPKPGTVSWFDLTIPNADAVRDFYGAVAGWTPMAIEMDGYNDYAMMPPRSKAPAAGICHARGENADLPPQWLIYITVANLTASLKACVARGGAIVRPAKRLGGARMAVVRDPAGAVAALYQPAGAKPAAKKRR
jgi:predicted enzyme related to lactoylglutathione lyase